MRSRIPMVAAWLPVLCWGQPPESPEPPIRLREGEAVTTTQRADATVHFAFEAAAGETYLVEVEQLGLDFVVTVDSPRAGPRAYDSPLLRDEREFVLLDDTAAGTYLITLDSSEHTGAQGRHTVRLRRLDADADARVIGAWSSMTRGAAASSAGGDEGRQAAIAAYSDAAERWAVLGRARERAQALYSLAVLEYESADWARSAEAASAASEAYAALEQAALAAGAGHRRAAALIELVTSADEGAPHLRQALYEEALELLEQARAVYERSGNRYAAALALNDRGLAHHVMGELQQAKASWLEATERFHGLDEWQAELMSLSNQAVIDVEEGHLLDAIARFERVVELLPEDRRSENRAWTLMNLAATHRLFGNLEQALALYAAALESHRENRELWGEAYSLRGIGQTYYGLGELDLATDYLEAALPKTREANDGRGEESAVRYLGNVAFRKQDYETALAHHEAALQLATSPLDIAYLNVLLANDLAALDRHAEARDLAEKARATADATETQLLLGDALLALGQARAELGDYAAATSELDQARSIYAALELRGPEADALHALAIAAREHDDLEAALRHGDAALAAVEDLRTRISHPELRAYNGALRRGYFDTQIDLLMAHQRAPGDSPDRHVREAFDVSERARTRMLVDLLNEAAVELSQGMDAGLTERRDRLYDQLAERSARRDTLVNQTAMAPEARDALASVMGEMRALETQLDLVEAQLRRANPRYAELSAPHTLTSAEVQAMLDARSVLLQYALGEDRSYAWLVTRDGIRAVELESRETIESAARTAFEHLGTFPADGRAGRQLDAALADLAALVWAPVADSIDVDSIDRILVASSGALQYLPFGVLPASDSAARILLEQYEFVVIPSMSGLAAQAAREALAPPLKTVAVFADPVLGSHDSRFADAGPSSDPGLTAGLSSDRPFAAGEPVGPSVGPGLARLTWTGREAEAIAELVPPDQRLVATGFDVTRDAVFAGDLDAYRYLHFATHGRVDSRNPGLSALVLSQLDERGRPEPRGELRLHDVYNLRLNADLVVLSACDTALGREVRGESLIGLTQGFMYAGARSVAASLWQVPDRATAELMTRFYRYMFSENLRPAEALRRAQLSIASERRTSHPYYWGAFILLGDWR